MKVTFLATRMDMRIARLALAAHRAGIILQLVAPADVKWELSLPFPFEELVPMEGGVPTSELLKQVLDFGSDLVHAFTTCSTCTHMNFLCRHCPLPLVGDAYDMVNPQYTTDHQSQNMIMQKQQEQNWLRAVDGLCLRSRYVRFLRECNSYCVGKNVLYLPEPCEPQMAIVRKKFSAQHGGLHVLFIIDYELVEGSPAYFLDMLRAAMGCNIVFHILEWPNLKIKSTVKDYIVKKFPNVHIHNYMKIQQYSELVARMDIVTQNTDFYARMASTNAYWFYNLDAAPYFFTNKVNEAVECNTIFMIPDSFQAMLAYAQKMRRGLGLIKGNLDDPSFWQGLAAQVAEIYSTALDIDRFSTIRQGKRLRKFYEKMLSAPRKRSIKEL